MDVKRIRPVIAIASAALLAITITGTAFGAPAGGVISAPILARGDFIEDVGVKLKFVRDGRTHVANAADAGEVMFQEITIAPGGTTGWHSHPGPVVVAVKAGTLTYVREVKGECVQTPFPAGTSFVDPGQGHAHTALNLGTDNLVLYATYFELPAGSGQRIDVPVAPPAC